MGKWLRFLSPISMPPKNRKELIPWLLFKLMYWLVGPIGLLIIAGAFILVTLFAFMISDYNGSSQGSYNNSTDTVTLTKKQQALNDNTNYNATKVANTWETGLTSDEVQAVDQAGLDVPTGLLLAIGKVVDNLKSNTNTTFRKYYTYLAPVDFSFIHKTDVTITYRSVWIPPHRSCGTDAKGHHSCHTDPGYWTCEVNQTDTPVTLITYANTWNGTYSSKYKDVITGANIDACGAHGSTLTYSSIWTGYDQNRVYTWKKIWNLFDHIKTVTGWFHKSTTNTEWLAGLMSVGDPTIDDPNVQAMVTQLTFLSGAIPSLGITTAPIATSSNIIQNVLSYTTEINYFSSAYQVPAVLIGGVMSAESHGLEFGGLGLDGDGTFTRSAAGALGLMQVEPTTAQGLTIIMPTGQMQNVGGEWYQLLYNPVTNISIGSDYLSNLYKKFNGNVIEVLAAYNAGPQAETNALVGLNAVSIDGVNIPNYQQTIDYVERIVGVYMPSLSSLGTINQIGGSGLPTSSSSSSTGVVSGTSTSSSSGGIPQNSMDSVLNSSAVNGQIVLHFGGALSKNEVPTASEFTVYEVVGQVPSKISPSSIQLSVNGSTVVLNIPKVPETSKKQEVTVVVQYNGHTQYDNSLTFMVPAQ